LFWIVAESSSPLLPSKQGRDASEAGRVVSLGTHSLPSVSDRAISALLGMSLTAPDDALIAACLNAWRHQLRGAG